MSLVEKLEEVDLDVTDELQHLKRKKYEKNTITFIHSLLNSGLIVYGDSIAVFLNDLGQEILSKQKDVSIPSDFRFYPILSNVPNAFSTDQKIIFVTTGLLARLNNERELAYILSHEIAHYLKRHVLSFYKEKNITNRKASIREYSRFSKGQEYEADSLGLILYNNAGFDSSAIFDSFHKLKYSHLACDSTIFKKDNFSSSLLFIPDKFFDIQATKVDILDRDHTLSTHPHIDDRIDFVRRQSKALEWEEEVISSYPIYEDVKSRCKIQSIRNYLKNANYIDALYLCHSIDQKYSDITSELEAYSWLGLATLSIENFEVSGNIQGELSRYYKFFTNLKDDQLKTLCFRQVLNILNTGVINDEEVIYNQIRNYYFNDIDFDLDRFSKNTFDEAKAVSSDGIDVTTLSRFERLKLAQKPSDSILFNENNFHIYGLTDIVTNDSLNSFFNTNLKLTTVDKYSSIVILAPVSGYREAKEGIKLLDKYSDLIIEKIDEFFIPSSIAIFDCHGEKETECFVLKQESLFFQDQFLTNDRFSFPVNLCPLNRALEKNGIDLLIFTRIIEGRNSLNNEVHVEVNVYSPLPSFCRQIVLPLSQFKSQSALSFD